MRLLDSNCDVESTFFYTIFLGNAWLNFYEFLKVETSKIHKKITMRQGGPPWTPPRVTSQTNELCNLLTRGLRPPGSPWGLLTNAF